MKVKVTKNYLNFIDSVRKSPKHVLRQLLGLASSDARSVTGSNLRKILLLTNEVNIEKLHPTKVDISFYHNIEESEKWRVDLIKEIIDMKHSELIPPGDWSWEEFEEILNFACSQ